MHAREATLHPDRPSKGTSIASAFRSIIAQPVRAESATPARRSKPTDADAMFEEFWPPGVAALCAAVLMPLAIRSRWLGHDNDFSGVQKVHRRLDVAAGRRSTSSSPISPSWPSPCASGTTRCRRRCRCCCARCRWWLIGMWEDITRGVHPWHRLAGAVVSGVLASWLRGGRHRAPRPADPRRLAPRPAVRAAAHLVHGGRRLQRDEPDRRRARTRRRRRADHVRRPRRGGRASSATTGPRASRWR